MFPLGVSNYSYLVAPNPSLFLLVGGCHLIFVEMIFVSPLLSCSFVVDFPTTPSILYPEALQFYRDDSCHFFLYSLLPYELVPILLFRRHCDVDIFDLSCCSIKIMVSLALFSCLL